MKKPEILATAGSMDELRRVIMAGADAVTIGEGRWGMRLPGDFTLSDITQAVQFARDHQAKIYVSVNKLMDNADLVELPAYLSALSEIGIDAIIFGDPAILYLKEKLAPHIALHWNAEMTSTNYATANYWASKGASRVILARELNMEQVLEFKHHAKLDVQVQIHGATNIYHSRRNLINSYLTNKRDSSFADDLATQSGLHLVEAERAELSHPIYEDMNGTHMLSADDICMLESLDELMAGGIDSFKIEGLLKSIDYNETVIKAYRSAVDTYMSAPENYTPNPAWLESIQKLQDPGRELTFGFFYKEQVY